MFTATLGMYVDRTITISDDEPSRHTKRFAELLAEERARLEGAPGTSISRSLEERPVTTTLSPLARRLHRVTAEARHKGNVEVGVTDGRILHITGPTDASKQLDAVRAQIVQEIALAMKAHGNLSPQSVLSLYR